MKVPVTDIFQVKTFGYFRFGPAAGESGHFVSFCNLVPIFPRRLTTFSITNFLTHFHSILANSSESLLVPIQIHSSVDR